MSALWEQRGPLAVAAAALGLYAYLRLCEPPTRGRRRRDRLAFKPDVFQDGRRRKGYESFPPPYPNGWYYLCQSSDLPRKGVRSFFVAGVDLVLFRTEEGEAGCVAAFCPHQGVHLGHGHVDKDGIRCAYHMWKFGTKGTLLDIQQLSEEGKDCSRDCARERNHVRSYPVCEASGMVACFIHAENEPPFEPWMIKWPQEHGYYHACSLYSRNMLMHVMEVSHNSADWYHFRTVHSTLATHWRFRFAPVHVTHEIHPGRCKLNGSLDDDGKPITDWSLLVVNEYIDTITLFGYFRVPNFIAKAFDVQVRFLGPCFPVFDVRVPFLGHFFTIMPLVPVGPFNTEVQILSYCEKWWTQPFAHLFARMLRATIDQDREAWENRTHFLPRNAVKGDFSWTKYDNWLAQFYSPSSIGYSNDLNW